MSTCLTSTHLQTAKAKNKTYKTKNMQMSQYAIANVSGYSLAWSQKFISHGAEKFSGSSCISGMEGEKQQSGDGS